MPSLLWTRVVVPGREHRLERRSVVTGVIAAAGLALFYVLVVAGASGSWEHLIDQSRQDWYYRLRPGGSAASGPSTGPTRTALTPAKALPPATHLRRH
jgi:hypothetical protein